LKTEILEHLQRITEQLKISNKKQLDKIYLEIKSEDKITRINLGNMDIDNKQQVPIEHLVIMMDESTFFDLKNNNKHPEDLMFEEKIKIKGNLELLK
jgi:hypothetical protein